MLKKLFQNRFQEPLAPQDFLLYKYNGINRGHDSLFADLSVCAF